MISTFCWCYGYRIQIYIQQIFKTTDFLHDYRPRNVSPFCILDFSSVTVCFSQHFDLWLWFSFGWCQEDTAVLQSVWNRPTGLPHTSWQTTMNEQWTQWLTTKNNLSSHLSVEDATKLALDKPLWRLLTAVGATDWNSASWTTIIMLQLIHIFSSDTRGSNAHAFDFNVLIFIKIKSMGVTSSSVGYVTDCHTCSFRDALFDLKLTYLCFWALSQPSSIVCCVCMLLPS